MKNRNGFTLVEILVVVAILGILAGFVFSIGSSVILKSQVKGTQGTILALVSACEQYATVFGEYPNLDYPGDCLNAKGSSYFSVGGTSVSAISTTSSSKLYDEAEYREFNKRLRYILEERMYELNEVEYGPFITQSLPKTTAQGDSSDNRFMYVDAWGHFLRVCPGRNHQGDTPKGPNHLSAKETTPQPKYRRDYPLDIFSIGPNGENNVDENGATQFITKFDTTVAGNDDVVSWFIDAKYTEHNYGAKK